MSEPPGQSVPSSARSFGHPRASNSHTSDIGGDIGFERSRKVVSVAQDELLLVRVATVSPSGAARRYAFLLPARTTSLGLKSALSS